ncbi:MAG: long-chain fatty acid--CoA ligase [Candidatus Dormiibacterota bacterium]
MSLGASTPPSQELNPDTIADRTTVGVLFRQAARLEDGPVAHYLSDGAWKVATWADLRRNVLAVASALVETGVQAGDHVVLMSPNRIDWLYCDFGIQAVGGITVPIYPSSIPEVAQRIAADCEATMAIVSDSTMAAKLKIAGPLKTVVRMDDEVASWLADPPDHQAEVVARLNRMQPDDVCTVVYTSGTTGEPKGAMLAHRNLVDICRAILKVHPLSQDDSTLSWLPYSHVLERINGVFVVLMFGGQLWISRGVDHLAEDLADVKPTILVSVPRVYEKMHAAVMDGVRSASPVKRVLFHWAVRTGTRFARATNPGPALQAQHRVADRLVLAPLRRRLTGGRLRFYISGGALLAREIEEFFWALGVPILNGWGMTETSSGAASNTLTQHRFETVGKPFPGVELKIAEDGEILVKGPGNMLGYHNNPTATAEMIKDGWICTGDIGEIDGDGFLRITDRKKSLFKTAVGKYVAPQPVEFQLTLDPLIARVVVIGDARPYVTALIVPDWDAVRKEGLDDAGLRAHVQQAIDEVNGHVGNWESIKNFTLLPEDFSEEKGELSLKLDIKRKVIQDHYKNEIESMYAGRSKPS